MHISWPPPKKELPIHEYADELVEFLMQAGEGESAGIGIIVGATGSGKTTQVPQAIYSHWTGTSEKEEGGEKSET